MISKMTAAQKKKVPQYLSKWRKAGYRTKMIGKRKAKKAISFLYENFTDAKTKPKYFIFLDSPMACQLAANLLKNTKWDEQLGTQLDSQLYSQLGSQLYSQLDSQLDSQLGSQLYSQLGTQLGSQLGSQLYSQLDSQLGSQLGSQLYSQLGTQLGTQLGSQKLEYFSHPPTTWWMGYYYGFYDFMLNELFKEQRKEFKLFTQFVGHIHELHYYLPFKDIVFISDFPKKISRNGENRLHSFDGAALLYRDTYSIYRFNGIDVSKELAETPVNYITKEMILKENNADIRREVIRKIGLERTIEVLGAKCVDKFETETGGKYELLMIAYDDREPRPYLKMQCSSSDEVFILGSAPGTKTAKAALEYLNNGYKTETTKTIWES